MSNRDNNPYRFLYHLSDTTSNLYLKGMIILIGSFITLGISIFLTLQCAVWGFYFITYIFFTIFLISVIMMGVGLWLIDKEEEKQKKKYMKITEGLIKKF